MSNVDVRPADGRSFVAMGVTVELLVDTDRESTRAAMTAVEAEFHRLEGIFTRFRPDSELSRLNAAGRGKVGAELLEVVDLAVRARGRTEGRFDPTVHDALVGAGYDRPFEELRPVGPPLPAGTYRCGGRIEIDHRRSTVSIESGFRLDLGGIAKGFAVDRACELLAGCGGCLVNAGGDIAVSGLLGGGPWPIGVDVPGESLTLAISDGAIATSGRDYRRWQRGAAELHHLIDPLTAAPAATDLLLVTVAADTAVEAEVLAKSLFLAGTNGARAEADALGLPTVLVTAGRDVILCGGLA